jgi:hypothetical protein
MSGMSKESPVRAGRIGNAIDLVDIHNTKVSCSLMVVHYISINALWPNSTVRKDTEATSSGIPGQVFASPLARDFGGFTSTFRP